MEKRLKPHGACGTSTVLALLCICTGPQLRTELPAPVGDRPNLSGLVRTEAAALMAKDIAAINLACAEGLPGAEGLDRESCLALIDRWTDRVQLQTNATYIGFALTPRSSMARRPIFAC